jgi:hypothetical protein
MGPEKPDRVLEKLATTEKSKKLSKKEKIDE